MAAEQAEAALPARRVFQGESGARGASGRTHGHVEEGLVLDVVEGAVQGGAEAGLAAGPHGGVPRKVSPGRREDEGGWEGRAAGASSPPRRKAGRRGEAAWLRPRAQARAAPRRGGRGPHGDLPGKGLLAPDVLGLPRRLFVIGGPELLDPFVLRARADASDEEHGQRKVTREENDRCEENEAFRPTART